MREIPLGGKSGLIAIVDDEDFDALWPFCWYASRGYAVRTHYPGYWRDGHYRVSMARSIMGLERGNPRQVDHMDLNRLNNQRSNLRFCDNALNRQNQRANRGSSSTYRGVDYIKSKDKWRAQIGHCGRAFHLGLFETEIEAALAAQEVRKKLMPFTIEQEIVCR